MMVLVAFATGRDWVMVTVYEWDIKVSVGVTPWYTSVSTAYSINGFQYKRCAASATIRQPPQDESEAPPLEVAVGDEVVVFV